MAISTTVEWPSADAELIMTVKRVKTASKRKSDFLKRNYIENPVKDLESLPHDAELKDTYWVDSEWDYYTYEGAGRWSSAKGNEYKQASTKTGDPEYDAWVERMKEHIRKSGL